MAWLSDLAARASDLERDVLGRIITGEMRTGVSDGLVLEAIAKASGAELGAVRRAALFLGDLSTVATLALRGGAEGLAAAKPRLFVPLLPMLAELATDFDEALRGHGGRAAPADNDAGARSQGPSARDPHALWRRSPLPGHTHL